jgi:hypothetical protein
MKVYRAMWWTAVAGILLLGLGVGLRLPPPALLAVFLGSGGLCAVAILCLACRHGSHTASRRMRIVATSAVLGGATAVSLVGFWDLLGAGVLALVLFFSLCSPAALRACRRGWRSVHRSSAARLETLALTDEQLSGGWQTSSRALRRRTSPAQKVAVVEERQTYLEEFERRNPSGFAAWLTSGSGVSDDLMPYLGKAGVEHATINWDELTRGRD